MCIVFFNDTATTEIYTLSLHDALPISARASLEGFNARERATPEYGRTPRPAVPEAVNRLRGACPGRVSNPHALRQPLLRLEEQTPELQSSQNLVWPSLPVKKHYIFY